MFSQASVGQVGGEYLWSHFLSRGNEDLALADLNSLASKFFRLHAFYGKFWQSCVFTPTGGFTPPPRGNPGSTTA